ncbi:hypothetical protein GCM10027035_19510 [Emticicia sediminis]
MENTTFVTVKQPLIWYNRILKIDFKKLFIALGKSATMFATKDIKSGIKELFDIFNALDLKSDTSGLAYRLLIKAMVNAAHNLATESRNQFKPELQEKEELYDDDDYVKFLDSLNTILEAKELTISSESFKNPRNITFLADFAESFKQWLKYFGLDEASAQNVANRLPAYFVMALNDEWRSNPSEYNSILQKTETPFTNAANRELEWQRYNAFLEKQINESVFGESFGLSQIYIPPRGYYKKNMDSEKGIEVDEKIQSGVNKQYTKIPFWVNKELDKWINTSESKHCIKFISGGPGSGKSSFAKIWSASIAAKQQIRVLFVPLHLFDLQSDVMEAIEKFVTINQDIQFSFNPLSPKDNKDKLLIVFDGLDELSQQGKYATEIAHSFVNTLDSLSKNLNRENKIQTLFLITGRELAIQANTTQFRLSEHIIHFLPYYLDIDERNEFADKENAILQIDQRNDWWIKYGKLKGIKYNGLPEQLQLNRLDEITAQPLLNYLVALSLKRGKIAFSKETNLNDIYKDLIDGVHERAYEGHEHKQIEGLNLIDFTRILEEIAISAWHGGDSRTTSIKRIENHITRSNLKPLMNKFEREAEKGILRLLTAFYFRQQGFSDGDKTFEFTHKSFGEYLTATRLVKQLERMSDMIELKGKEYDSGWSEEEALKKWMEIASPTAIDEYLFVFVKDEIKDKSKEKAAVWQQNLAKLLSYMLRYGMPMLDRKSHKEEVELARNGSEALLVLHAACAHHTQIISKINSPTPEGFGEWISTLQPQRIDNSNVLGLTCLCFLDLSYSVLTTKDLFEVNLSNSILVKTQFQYSILVGADLQNSQLNGVIFAAANLKNANLENANLENSIFIRANLENANLGNCDLSQTFLKDCNLSEANLGYAILDGAILDGVNLTGANINFNELLSVERLHRCKLDSKMLSRLKKLKPQLFNKQL